MPSDRERRRGRGRSEPEPTDDELEEPEMPDLDDAGFFPEFLRRSLSLGFTGLFMTEEAVRKAFGDKVPRDWVEFFIAQGDRTRQDMVDRFSVEFGRVLSAMDPVETLKRLVDGQTLEVSAKIRFAKDDSTKRSTVSARARAGQSEADE